MTRSLCLVHFGAINDACAHCLDAAIARAERVLADRLAEALRWWMLEFCQHATEPEYATGRAALAAHAAARKGE